MKINKIIRFDNIWFCHFTHNGREYEVCNCNLINCVKCALKKAEL